MHNIPLWGHYPKTKEQEVGGVVEEPALAQVYLQAHNPCSHDVVDDENGGGDEDDGVYDG